MIEVLRLGHRLPRDSRITTHVALTARAFGATAMYYTGMHDHGMETAVENVVKQFGGPFTVQHIPNAKTFLTKKKQEHATIIHLSMYGLPFHDILPSLKTTNLLLIVGGEKVPPAIYHLADHNLSVGNQPHSEVSALASFLDHHHGLQKHYTNARRTIIGQARGKKIITLEKGNS